jgi:hypothetical protein
MAEAKRYVVIDVAKAQLDVALGPNGERLAVANDERAESARWLSAWNPLAW